MDFHHLVNCHAWRTIIKARTEVQAKKAIKEGNTEPWQLADYFNVEEPLVIRGMEYYNGAYRSCMPKLRKQMAGVNKIYFIILEGYSDDKFKGF